MKLQPFAVDISIPPYAAVWEHVECRRLDLAELIAGEFLAVHAELAALVVVYRRDPPRKWHATLTADYEVHLQAVCDDTPGETVAVRAAEHRLRMAGHMERIAKRRQRKKTQAQQDEEAERETRAAKFTNGVPQPVVCLDPIKGFPHATAAAQWAGVSQPCISRALKKGYAAGRFRFRYARELIKELEDEQRRQLSKRSAGAEGPILPQPGAGERHERSQPNPNHAALLAAAQHAVSLRLGKEVQAVSRS